MSDTVVESVVKIKTDEELDMDNLKVGIVQLIKEEHPSLNELYKLKNHLNGGMLKHRYHKQVENKLNSLKSYIKDTGIHLHVLINERSPEANYTQVYILLSEFSQDIFAMDRLQNRLAMKVKVLPPGTYSKHTRRTNDWIAFDTKIIDRLPEFFIEFGMHEIHWMIEMLQLFERVERYSVYRSEINSKRYLPIVEGKTGMGMDIHQSLVGADLDNILYVGSEGNLGQIASKLDGCIILTDNPGLYKTQIHSSNDIRINYVNLYHARQDIGFLIMRYWQMLVGGSYRDPYYFDEIMQEIIASGMMDQVSLSNFLDEVNSLSVWIDLSTDSNRIHFQSKYVEIFEQLNYSMYSELDIRTGNHVIDTSEMNFMELAAFSITLMVMKEHGLIDSWLVLPNFASRMDYQSKYNINSIINLIDTRGMMFYTSNPKIIKPRWETEFGTLILDTDIKISDAILKSLSVDHLRNKGLIMINHNSKPTTLKMVDYKFSKNENISLPSIYGYDPERDEQEIKEEEEVIMEKPEVVIRRDDYAILVYLNHSYETVNLDKLKDDLILGEIDLELDFLNTNRLIFQYNEGLMITNPGRKIVRQLLDNLKLSDQSKVSLEENGEHYLLTELRVKLNEVEIVYDAIGVLTDLVIIAGRLETGMKPLYSKILGILAIMFNDKDVELGNLAQEVGYYLNMLHDLVSEIDDLEITEADLEEEEIIEEVEKLDISIGGTQPWYRMSSDEYLRNTLLKDIDIELDTEVLRSYMRIRNAAIDDSISRDYIIENKLISEDLLMVLIDAGLVDSYNNTVDIRELDQNKLVEIEQKLEESLDNPSDVPSVSDSSDITDKLSKIPTIGNIPKAGDQAHHNTEQEEESFFGSQVLETRQELEGIYRILCYYHINNSIASTDDIGIQNAKQKGLIMGNGNPDLTNRGREIIIEEILPLVNGVTVDLNDIRVDNYELDDLRDVLKNILVHIMKTDDIELMSSSLSLFKTLDRYKDIRIDDDGSFITHVRQNVQLYLDKITVDRNYVVKERATEKVEDEIEDIENKEEYHKRIPTEVIKNEEKTGSERSNKEKPRKKKSNEKEFSNKEKVEEIIGPDETISEDFNGRRTINIDTIRFINLKGISHRNALALEAAKFITIYDIATMFNPIDELVKIKGIGIKTANKITDLINEIQLSKDPKLFMRDPNTKAVRKKTINEILKFGPDVLELIEKLLIANMTIDPSTMLFELLLFIIKELTGKTVELVFNELISNFNKIGSETGVNTTQITVDYTSINNLWITEEEMRESLMQKFKGRLFDVMSKFSYNDEFVEELNKL